MTKEPILVIIILIVIAGFAVGPIGKSREKGAGSARSSSLSTRETDTNMSTAESLKDIEDDIEKLEKDVAKKVAEAKRSPYYDKIRLSRISGLNNPNPDKEYVTLTTRLEDNEVVNVTGWYLKSERTGNFARIGRATLLPFPFKAADSDITLRNGDRLILSKGFSPIGISFRTNMCTGYFEENRTFTPSLSRSCPRPSEEELPRFSSIEERHDECVRLIGRIGRCTTKGSEYLRDLPDTVTYACKTYIQTQINYNTCVAQHFGDTSFPGHEYRAYLKTFGKLWKDDEEVINLHDSSGLIVDTISY